MECHHIEVALGVTSTDQEVLAILSSHHNHIVTKVDDESVSTSFGKNTSGRWTSSNLWQKMCFAGQFAEGEAVCCC